MMRIAVISDIHGNLAALQAVLTAIDDAGAEAIWCLGDVVGYGAEPIECLDQLAGLSAPLVRVAGNHDLGTAGRLDLAAFNPEGRTAILWTRPRLAADHRRWLEREPRYDAGNDATLVHGSPRDPTWEYITSSAIAETGLAYLERPLGFFGHTHLPAIYAKNGGGPVKRIKPGADSPVSLPALGQRWLVNPGSVGQPRDGDPRAAFLLFDPVELSVTFKRVPYPVEVPAAKIRAAGLPAILADRLAYGL